MSGITNDPTGTNQVKSKAVIQILSLMAQMCSITNTAHWLRAVRGAFRSLRRSSAPFRPRMCGHVVMWSCLGVVMLK